MPFAKLLPLLLLSLLGSCALHIEEAGPRTALTSTKNITWPAWQTESLKPEAADKSTFDPNYIQTPHGEVITYGPRPDGTEHFAVISKRPEINPPGIFSLRLCFLPTSIFAGPCPLSKDLNTLQGPDRKLIYPAFNYRSTFFDLYPATTETAKGLLVYHTSIMLLSTAEKLVVAKFRKLGWNVLVALPPDSLYRTKLPAATSEKGTLENAAALVALDMDQHYLEQAFATRLALSYLAQTRPSWLTGKRVLMGTSAGTFAMPAEALLTPDWDALVFVSGGTNLLSLYESGSAGVFPNSLKWLGDARKAPPKKVTNIYTNQEYHQIFQHAATLTRFHSGALAPRLRDQRILMIAGTIDHIMPDQQALSLHQALGRPERWTAPLGHHLIAVQLILEVDRIDKWLTHPTSPKPN